MAIDPFNGVSGNRVYRKSQRGGNQKSTTYDIKGRSPLSPGGQGSYRDNLKRWASFIRATSPLSFSCLRCIFLFPFSQEPTYSSRTDLFPSLPPVDSPQNGLHLLRLRKRTSFFDPPFSNVSSSSRVLRDSSTKGNDQENFVIFSRTLQAMESNKPSSTRSLEII